LSKSIFKSKYFYIGLLTIIAGAIAQDWRLALSGALTIVNRFFTDRPVHVVKKKVKGLEKGS